MNDLISVLTGFGLEIEGVPLLDNKFHRVRHNRSLDKRGFYTGTVINDKIYCTYGTWDYRENDQKYSSNGSSDHGEAAKVFKLLAAERAKKQKAGWKAAAKKAQEYIAGCMPCPPDHPYLYAKKIQARDVLVDAGNKIVIPLYDPDGNIATYQTIDADGNKKFMYGGRKQGCCHIIQGDNNTVCVCEGWATGISVNQATGHKVLVAIDEGNLTSVVNTAIGMFQSSKVLVCADNDHSKERNVGLERGRKIAKETKAELRFPQGIKGTDFNDMANEKGHEAVKVRIDASAPVLPSISAMEIMAKEYPPIKWAVKGVIPEGLTVLAGRPKFGKSWLMLGLSYAISTGQLAWGYAETIKGDVYYLALEDSERRLQDRILAMEGYFDTFPENLHIYTDFFRLDEGFLVEVENLIAMNENVGCIIIDTLQKVRPRSNGGKRNLYQAEYEDYEKLQKLAIKHGVPIIAIHHTRKENKANKGNPWDEMSGSTGIQGVADTLIVCTRDGNKGMMHVTGREVDEESYPMEFHKINMTWTLSAPEGQSIDVGPMMLTEWFKDHDEITVKEAAGVFGISEFKARKALEKLIEEGKVKIRTGGKNLKFYSPTEIF